MRCLYSLKIYSLSCREGGFTVTRAGRCHLHPAIKANILDNGTNQRQVPLDGVHWAGPTVSSWHSYKKTTWIYSRGNRRNHAELQSTKKSCPVCPKTILIIIYSNLSKCFINCIASSQCERLPTSSGMKVAREGAEAGKDWWRQGHWKRCSAASHDWFLCASI